MPRTALSAASASRAKCGCRREAGKARTSATLRTQALARSAKKSSAARFECPTEYTTGVTRHHARAAPCLASTGGRRCGGPPQLIRAGAMTFLALVAAALLEI